MGRPSLPKALLVLFAAVVWAAAEDLPESPRRHPPSKKTAKDLACAPGSTGLVVDLGTRAAPENLGTSIETPPETPGDPPPSRFQHIKPTGGDEKDCHARFAAFSAGCPDCPAAVAPAGEVTLDVARQMFASDNKGLGGLVMSLGDLTRRADVAGLQARVAGLFDGTGTLRPDALAAALAAPLDASGAVAVGARGTADARAALDAINAASVLTADAAGNPRLSLPVGVGPPAPLPEPSWYDRLTSSLPPKVENYVRAPLRSAQADLNESAVGYYASRARAAVEQAVGIAGRLVPLKPESGAANPGMIIRNPAHSWGTAPHINMLRMAAAEVQAKGGPMVQVNDVSRGPMGGPFYPPHRSHQRGVDADIPSLGDMGRNALLAASVAKAARESGSGLQYIFSDQSQIHQYRTLLSALAARGVVERQDADAASRAFLHEGGHSRHFHVRTLR